VIDISIKLAVLTAIAWLATRSATHAQAATAHVIWRVVLVSPLAWFALSVLLAPRIYVQPTPGVWPTVMSGAASAVPAPVAVVYFVVAAALLLRLVFGMVAVSRLRASGVPLSDDDRRLLRAGAGSDLDSIGLAETPLDVPVTAGISSPVVLLPRGWRSLPADALRAIVHHEIAHVRRRDYAWGVFAAAVEAVLWFHPASWVAGNRLRWFAELASDAHGAGALGDRRYASELLALATRWRGARAPRYGVTVGASSSVGRRIALLLEERPATRRRAAVLACAAAAILLAVPAAGTVRFGPPRSAVWTAPPISLHPSGHDAGHATSHQSKHHGM
jgi:beta-lactamase regulating signal transducer with metallopeptidase domain